MFDFDGEGSGWPSILHLSRQEDEGLVATDPPEDSRGLREGGEGEGGGQEEGTQEEEEEGQEKQDETGGHPVHRQQWQHFPTNGTKKTPFY